MALDVERAVFQIESALFSANQRSVILPLARTNPTRPSFTNLGIFLQQTLSISGFDGTASVFLLDLQTSEEIHFIYQQGELLPTQPDLPFNGSSLIKIPIMISIFSRIGEDPDPEVLNLLDLMITQSGNDPADWVTQRVIEQNLGPIEVTKDMQTLGLENTFWAGYFYAGAPLLIRYETPGNMRTDVIMDRDPYNQTTASEMGMLLEDIYQCATTGGSALTAVFGDSITQAECQQMIDLLLRNEAPFLIQAGVPDTIPVAHKHGWVSFGGIINTMGDAAIVYTPNGNYILVCFMYHPVQLIWDPISTLMANLSEVVYNYFILD
jgi:hypothetical protein